VQRLFEVAHDREPVAPLPGALPAARREIAVSVDALFS